MWPVTDVVLALDVGGTKLLGGLVTADGAVVLRRLVPTPRDATGCDPGLIAFAGLAADLVADAGKEGLNVVAAGVGFAEYVHDDRLTSSEVFAWDRQPAGLLAEVLPDRPVAVEADVRCAALAEAVVRTPASTADGMFYLSWGTGLSCALVVDGRSRAGARGEALAIGEWPVDAAVDPSWNGNLEAYASGRGMETRYEKATGQASSGPEIVRRADEGDAVAAGVVDSAAAAVAGAVRDCVLLLDPATVVLGGGVGSADHRLTRQVAERVPAMLHRAGPPTIERARAGSDAGLLGAAYVAWRATEPRG